MNFTSLIEFLFNTSFQVTKRKVNGFRARIKPYAQFNCSQSVKIEFTDGLHPMSDWVSGDNVFAYDANGQDTGGDESEFDCDLNDFPEDDGIGHEHGLEEIPGGIAVDSGAAENAVPPRSFPDYQVEDGGPKRTQTNHITVDGNEFCNMEEVELPCVTRKS